MNVSESTLGKNIPTVMSRSTEENGCIRYDSHFSRIEELIKGKTFSWEEINHLVAILNSRVDIELERKSSSDARGDTKRVAWMHGISNTQTEEKQHVIDIATIGTFHKKSDVPVGVGASPIDIARAYMAGRTSEHGNDHYSCMSKGESAEPSNKYAQQLLMPSPLSKPSICWPGAMVNDQNGYKTPQSRRNRYMLHDFSRTPYSRPISSKSTFTSTTKLQANSRYSNTSNPFQQSQTSVYGQVKMRGDSVDGYGSVGPIRRIRNKFASEVRPRGSMILSLPIEVPSEMLKSNVLSGFLPNAGKNMEPGETSGVSKYLSDDNVSGFFDTGVLNTNSSSSQTVRKILEHLDRHKPTPKEKEAELKLVTALRKSSSEACDTINGEKISSMHSQQLASHDKTTISGPYFSVDFNQNRSNTNYLVKFQDKGMDEAKDAVNGNPKTPVAFGANAMPTFGLKGTSGPFLKNMNENAVVTTTNDEQEKSLHLSHAHLSNGQDVNAVASSTFSELSKNHGTKPLLPSISINKPDFRAASSDNGPGFTFPVATASGFLSEPPTPSIIPSSLASIPSQAMGMPTVPSYSFGSNKSPPRLVFSFPSTSNASLADDSDIKFSFGSEEKTRMSFHSFENDTICY